MIPSHMPSRSFLSPLSCSEKLLALEGAIDHDLNYERLVEHSRIATPNLYSVHDSGRHDNSTAFLASPSLPLPFPLPEDYLRLSRAA